MAFGFAAQFSFAAMAVGLYFTDLEISRRQIKDRLVFHSVRFGRNINGYGVFLGFMMHNISGFPIELELKELRTRIGDQVPLQTTFPNKNITVYPSALGWFDDHIITVKDAPKPGTLEGFIEFKIIYGRPGKLKFDLAQKKQIVAAFDEQGNLGHGSWHEAKRDDEI